MSEAGSAVSDLLDERLRRLEQQLEDSQKSCDGLAGQVEVFTKATREMCGSAGNAAKGFGIALQVDSTIKIEPPKPSAAALVSTSDEGSGEDDVQAATAAAAAAAAAVAAAAAKRRRSGSLGSREPARAELLALQLNECASEMEEHLLVQVMQPLERMRASRNDVQMALRGRTRAAENLCAAHSDYARAVSRCQTLVDVLHGGPPLDVVQAGDIVVRESDAFAQAHGLAEEALSSLLEERGQCLREAASSLKAAQAGFFVRASRCVSASVGWESADEVLSRAMDDTKKNIPTTVEDTKLTPTATGAKMSSPCGSPIPSGRVPLAAVVAAVRDADGGIEDSEGGSGTAVAARSISFNAGVTGINGRPVFTGKGRKKGDGDALDDHGRMQSEMKRRRSSGWFRRLTSSFQSNRERSASDELLERAESPLPEVATYGDDSDAEDGAGVSRAPPGRMKSAPILSTKAAAVAAEVVSLTAPPTVFSSATTSEERSLFAPDRVPEGDTPPLEQSSEKSSEQSSGLSSERPSEQSSERSGQSNGSDPGGAPGGTVGPVAVRSEAVAERMAGLEEGGGCGGGGVETLVGGRGRGRTETDEEESDDETGSYTTEGFGSDDAGDLWDGGRATGLLNRVAGEGDGEGREKLAIEGDDGRSEAEGGSGRTGVVAGALGDAAPIDAVGEAAAGVAREGDMTGAAKAPLGRHLPGIENGGSGVRTEGAAPAAALEVGIKSPPRNGGKRNEVGVDGGDGGGGGDGDGGRGGGGGENGGKSEGGCRVSDSRHFCSGDRKVTNGGSAAEGAQSARLRSPAVVIPTSPRASTARSMGPPAPPPVVASLPDAAIDSPLPTVSSERWTLFSPPKSNSSPAISEDSNKESPRAWRMSWWARASDRHQPPPPISTAGGDGDDDATVAGSSVAAALAAAAAGGEEAAPALRPGGEFAPAFSGGDAPAPAIVDRGNGAGKTLAGDGVEAAAVTAAVAAERRTRDRLRRAGRLGKLWLSADTLVNAQTRPLEAACRYLDVAGLARATGVCRTWGKRLGGEAGAREWIRCVRLADGVPEGCRAGFYLHVLYDQPSWVPKAHGSTSRGRPQPGVYEECLRKADAEEEVSITISEKLQMISEDMREDGCSPLTSADGPSREPYASRLGGAGRDNVEPSSAPRSYKWLKEIETDVLRTCPADAVGEFDRIIWRKSTSAIPDRGSSPRRAPSTSLIKSNGSSRSGGSGGSDGFGGSGGSSSVRRSIALRSSLFGPDISRDNGDGGGGGGSGESTSARGERRKATQQTLRAASVGTRPVKERVDLVGEGRAGAAVEAAVEAEAAAEAEALGGMEAAARGVEGNGKISEAFWEGGGEEVVSRRFSVAGGGTREKLRRVLRAFAVYNRRVSYCQGMNFVALALLEASSGDDENAFWILVGMCDYLDLEGLWCQGLERLDLCFFSLDRLLRRHCPSLRQHLADEGVELSMFTSRWFVTLFTSTDVFGRGISRKILDMLMVEGWPLIFKLSLGVLLEMRPLLEPGDMESILKVTKFPRAHLFGLRRDGTGRGIAGATFEEASQGSLCESIRAGQMIEHALLLHISEETLEQHLLEYRLEKLPEPGSD